MRRLIAWVSRGADTHAPNAGDSDQPSKPSSAPTSDPELIGTDGVAGHNPDDVERASEAILRVQSGAQPNEEIVRALVPDDQPRFLTFIFGLPGQLPLPHGATVWQHLKPGEIKDPSWDFETHIPMGDAISAEPLSMRFPFVSIKVWQPKAKVHIDAGEAGLLQVMHELWPAKEEPDRSPPAISTSIDAYRTVIEAVTQAAEADGEPPAPNLVAASFNRCLVAVNRVIDAYSVAFDDPELAHISASHLGMLAFAGSRPITANQFDAGPTFYLLPYRPPATEKEIIDQEGWTRTMAALAITAQGNPFVAGERFYHQAVRAMAQGDFGQVMVLIATAGEISLNGLLRSVVVEGDGADAAQAIFDPEDHRTGLAARLRREYEPRLGGGPNWNPDVADGDVAKWWAAVEVVRGRVVHGGYQPTPQEAHDALIAAEELDRFIDDRLADRRFDYPITVLSKLGQHELEKRGWWSRRMRELAPTLDMTGHWASIATSFDAGKADDTSSAESE